MAQINSVCCEHRTNNGPGLVDTNRAQELSVQTKASKRNGAIR